MKHTINKILVAVIGLVLFAACHKVEDLPYHGNGEAVVLTASKTTVAPALADTNNAVVTFSWTNPNYATDTSNYKFVLEVDSTGRGFAKKLTKTVTGAYKMDLTGRELNNILLNYGFALGSPYEVDVRIASSYVNNNERYYSNVVKLTVTPFNDPPILVTDKSTVVCALATQTQVANKFSWTNAFNGFTGNVSYVIQYDSAGKNFASPKTIAVGDNINEKELLQKELNETGLNCAISGGSTGKVDYRLMATTAQGAVSYSNTVSITITTYAVKLYLVGGSSPAGWSPADATPLIADPRFPGTFFTYVKLIAGGGGIKFLTENTDWSTPTQTIFGDVNNPGVSGNLTSVGGGNDIQVPADGIYRVTVDLAASKYYLQTGGIGGVGLVGAVQPIVWDPPSAIKMASFAPNRMIVLTNMVQNDEFKFHDGNTWDNSTNVGSRWYDLAAGDQVIINGAGSGGNFQWTGTTGRVRAIFDYGDVANPKYLLAPATEMRVVGNGIVGVNDWDPGTSPQMTYMGNGVWSITLDLKADMYIKFLAGNAWGAFDYEDDSGQSNAVGTPKKIKWEGGSDFRTPAVAGTYTITLDEYAQTVTIN